MSYRPNLPPTPVITNGNMANTVTSKATILSNLSMASYSFVWTGSSPNGSISVQASNDFSLNPNGTVLNAGTWNTMTLNYQGNAVTSIPVTGNSGNALIDIELTGIYAIQAVYTPVSGTGTLNALITGKAT